MSVYPLLHLQADTVVLDASECDCDAHATGDADPIIQYPPAVHGKQDVCATLPATLMYVPAGQCWHVSAEFAPCVVDHLPATQAAQFPSVSDGDTVEYFPAPHATQFVMAPCAGNVVYFPAAQFRQTAAVVAANVPEYFPATQARQSASVLEVFATSIYLPRPHKEHVS